VPHSSNSRLLVLASTSPHRRVLLERLGLTFECVPPVVAETPLPGEPAPALVRRLAREKAEAGGRRRPGALVIGSDQLAARDDQILGKPLTHAAAIAQLQASAGRELRFMTAVCVLDSASGAVQEHLDETLVRMRALSADVIERYLKREQPYDCAGSFKGEGLGIALFEWVRSDDPTALQGLPLIWLSGALERAGLAVI
jgi:7-methyl-GTP pyrophosphatase